MTKTTSPRGRAKLTVREGKKNKAYLDSRRIPTIGVGHTGRSSLPPVYMGMVVTDAQIDTMLQSDLKPVELAINKALKVPVSQNEFDAMVSLWFNTGAGYVPTSQIIKNLNLGNIKAAAQGFDAYHSPPEIIGRRNTEKAQFLEPDPDPIEDHNNIATRAQVLNARASENHIQAKATAQGSGFSAVTGAAVVAGVTVSQHAGHHLAWYWWVLGFTILAGAVLDGYLAWSKYKKAKTLQVNAAEHTAIAKTLAPAAGLAGPVLVPGTLIITEQK